MIFILLYVFLGLMFTTFIARIVSDFTIARNPLFKGELRSAKIIGFYCYTAFRVGRYFAVVQYSERGEKIESIVERAKKDKIGDKVAILVAPKKFTVRYNWYLPYGISLKICDTIIPMFISIPLIFYSIHMRISLFIVAFMIGGILGCFYHVRWVYNSFYSPNSRKQKFEDCVEEARFDIVLNSMVKISSNEEEKPDRGTTRNKICCLILLSVLFLKILFSISE